MDENLKMSPSDSLSSKMSARRKGLFILFLMSIVFLFSLFGIEITGRTFFREKMNNLRKSFLLRRQTALAGLQALSENDETNCTILHPYYGYTYRPNMEGQFLIGTLTDLEVDPHGFRNNDRDFMKMPEEVMVIGIFGGSAVFGQGLAHQEDTLSTQLEAALKNCWEPEKSVAVFNFGIPGWHYPQQSLLVSQIIDHLDMVITCDGYNELLVPFWNTFPHPETFNAGQRNPIPKHYPFVYGYEPLRKLHKDPAFHHRYPLTLYEANYRENAFLQRLSLYLIYRRLCTLWLEKSYQSRLERFGKLDNSTLLAEPELGDFESCVKWGVNSWRRGTACIDTLAREKKIPVLHTIQPFRYARPGSKVLPLDQEQDNCRGYFMKSRHPSYWYGMLRRAAMEQYPRPDSGQGIWFLDMADALPWSSENWLDHVHLSRRGTQALAQKMADIIAGQILLK